MGGEQVTDFSAFISGPQWVRSPHTTHISVQHEQPGVASQRGGTGV